MGQAALHVAKHCKTDSLTLFTRGARQILKAVMLEVSVLYFCCWVSLAALSSCVATCSGYAKAAR